MAPRAFFIGGPGTLSASAIAALLERGWEIAVYSHPRRFDELPPGTITAIGGERNDSTALSAAMRDFRPDVVLDFICYTPQEARQVIELARGQVGQFIFVSTVDVYGYPLARLPFREDDPWHPTTQSPYADEKRLCEKLFRQASSDGDLPLTIARPAYSFGPRFILNFTSRNHGLAMLRRLQSGRPVLVPGDGTTLMHVSAAPNTGRMIAALAGQPVALGRDYTCGHPNFMTHLAYLELFAGALGVQPNPVFIPTETILSIDHPEIRSCLLPALTRYNVAFSIERFQRDFPECHWQVSLPEWAAQVVEWNRVRGLLDEPDIAIIDDQVIDAWHKSMSKFSLHGCLSKTPR